MIDLHCHTYYSDGSQSISEACLVAKDKKLDLIAITDHYTTSWKADIINHLTKHDIDKYIKEIEYTSKKNDYPLLKGIEIDTESSFDSIIGIEFDKFDIILLEYILSIKSLKKYVYLIRNYLGKLNLNKSPIIGLAHPNIHLKLSNRDFKKEFIPCLLNNNIYFELNNRYSSYFRKDIKKIEKMISKGVQFTIGSDAHQPSKIGQIEQIYSFLNALNGIDNLIKLKKPSQ